jgi:hypothetical protein
MNSSTEILISVYLFVCSVIPGTILACLAELGILTNFVKSL